MPYHPIIKERIEPRKIYPKTSNGAQSIQQMLEAFEDKQHQLRQANLIILKVENEDKDGGAMRDDNKDNGYIVGGYASHAWSASFNLRGDDTCFLFNLT